VLTHWTQSFTPGPGGVPTEEVGTVTGDLVLRTEVGDDGAVLLRVKYAGAAEWYTVAGGRFDMADHADREARAEALHAEVVGILARGGADLTTARLTALE
jgi:hypothetical protein